MKILNIITIVLSSAVFGQVAIGKTTVSNSSVSLEFGGYVTAQGKGVVLPWVDSQAAVLDARAGTIVYDTSDTMIKYKKNDGSWFALSKNEIATVNGVANVNTTGIVNTALQLNLTEKSTAKTSIGNPTTVPGILVLEDSNKAMILPKVPSPHLNIANPEPGLLVYDTISKQLAVYNGKVWSFWKP